MPCVLRLPNQITRSAPGPNIFQYVCSTFATILKRGLSPLSMSRQNISLPIFLQNLCPAINACAFAIKLWGGRQLHLLTRECEVMWDVGPSPLTLNDVSQLPFPSLPKAILYFLQYIAPFVRIFYLTRFYLSYLFVPNIQPGLHIYLKFPILHQHTTKFP